MDAKPEIKRGNRLSIKTEVYSDGAISQHTFSDIDGIRKHICTEVIQTKDAQIRECLIKLGWTPPAKNHTLSAAP